MDTFGPSRQETRLRSRLSQRPDDQPQIPDPDLQMEDAALVAPGQVGRGDREEALAPQSPVDHVHAGQPHRSAVGSLGSGATTLLLAKVTWLGE